jgi:two-component system LytT family response regulator
MQPRAAPLDRLALRLDGRILFLRIEQIDWIEAADDYVRLHVGKQTLEHRDTLTRLEQRLPADRFLRIHRSTIVNVDRIREMQPWFQGDYVLIMQDGTRLTTGRSYRDRLKALLERWR